jgi:hypothetical protein
VNEVYLLPVQDRDFGLNDLGLVHLNDPCLLPT